VLPLRQKQVHQHRLSNKWQLMEHILPLHFQLELVDRHHRGQQSGSKTRLWVQIDRLGRRAWPWRRAALPAPRSKLNSKVIDDDGGVCAAASTCETAGMDASRSRYGASFLC
jgi:hypothetical protein